MIKGTNANCKITNISISETKATLKLLIFATNSTVPSKSFHIYIQNENSKELKRLTNQTYWIDKINNYNNDSNNVNTNKYKEIILEIDITDQNTSEIKDNKWVRPCFIHLINADSNSLIPAWSSEKLTLISDEFEVPEIYDITFNTTNKEINIVNGEVKSLINIEFKLKYNSEKDFNYNNKNILASIKIISLSTDKVLEQININTSTDVTNRIKTSSKYLFGEPIVIEIILTNRLGKILSSKRKIYTPFEKLSNTYVKTKTGVHKVIAYYISVDPNTEHEGEWL